MNDQCHRAIAAVIAIAIASISLPAMAIDDNSKAAVRTMVNEGAEFYKQGRYEDARRKFMDAHEVVKVPTVAVWAAQAHEKLGKWVAASELYESALLMQPNELWVGNAQQKAQDQAQAALMVLKPRIPTLKINLVGAVASETEVTVDDVKVPNALLSLTRPMDPGLHTVIASRGGKSVTQTVVLKESQKESVALNVPAADSAAPVPPVAATPMPAGAPAQPVPAGAQPVPNQAVTPFTPMQPAPADSANSSHKSGRTQRTLGWMGLGVGAAGLAVGAGSAVYVAAKRSQLHSDGCNGNECPNNSFDTGVSQYNAARTISTIGFVAGGVCAAAGLTLLFTSPKQESGPSVGLLIGPGNIALTGAL